jgi:hypothetical protein
LTTYGLLAEFCEQENLIEVLSGQPTIGRQGRMNLVPNGIAKLFVMHHVLMSFNIGVASTNIANVT